MPKVVVSTTLQDPTWTNTTVVRDLDGVRALKETDGGPIQVAGSATLVQSLHKAGLVDQWNLMVFPVVLGSGKRLFPVDAEDKQKLALTETRSYANGVQLSLPDRALRSTLVGCARSRIATSRRSSSRPPWASSR